MLCGIQMNLLVALSADRYYAVCKPLEYFKQKSSGCQNIIALVSIVIGIAVGIPMMLGANNEASQTCFVVDILSFHYLVLGCIWTIVTSVVIIIFYGLIYKFISDYVSFVILWIPSQLKFMDLHWSPQKKRRNEIFDQQAKEINMAKTMFLIIISYLIFWMPITINFTAVIASGNRRFIRDISETLGLIFECISVLALHLNLVINPVIYAYQMKEVRDGINKLLSCK